MEKTEKPFCVFKCRYHGLEKEKILMLLFLSFVHTMLCLFLKKPVEQSMIPVATQVITAVDPFKNQNDQDFS